MTVRAEPTMSFMQDTADSLFGTRMQTGTATALPTALAVGGEP